MENKPKKNIKKKLTISISSLLLAILLGGFAYWYSNKDKIYIEKAEITAPQIDLSSDNGGSLDQVMVKAGDQVKENTLVAQIGNQTVKTKSAGVITDIKQDLGKNFNRGEAVASMIIPSELRVVGHIDENNGLQEVKVGQRAVFTVDAFGSKQFVGTVDEISQTSRESGVVFNISDKREIKQFDIKIRFNPDQYPELKDGMSAKVWIYKK